MATEFETTVLLELSELKTKQADLYKSLLGNGQPGRIQAIESRIIHEALSVNNRFNGLALETTGIAEKLRTRLDKIENRFWYFSGAATLLAALVKIFWK